MKILEHTSRRLVILHHPIYNRVAYTILIVVGLGGGLYYYAMTQNPVLLLFHLGVTTYLVFVEFRDDCFIFDKTLGSLIVKQRRLLGEQVFKYLLQNILAVEVFRLNRKAVLYGVQLLTHTNEKIEINYAGTFSESEAQAMANQIRQFLEINN